MTYCLLPDHVDGLGRGEAGAGPGPAVRGEVREVQTGVAGPGVRGEYYVNNVRSKLPALHGGRRDFLVILTIPNEKMI